MRATATRSLGKDGHHVGALCAANEALGGWKYKTHNDVGWVEYSCCKSAEVACTARISLFILGTLVAYTVSIL